MEEKIKFPGGLRKILITGPESTGKSELARHLAGYFHGKWVPEYARKYIGNLDRKYIYDDVIEIAHVQISEYNDFENNDTWVFFDTWLIITKIWLEIVYGKVPVWIENALTRASFDLVLICAPDIPWIPDPMRENGGEKRIELYNRYMDEIMKLQWPYIIVEGAGEKRLSNAVDGIRNSIIENGT